MDNKEYLKMVGMLHHLLNDIILPTIHQLEFQFDG